MNSQAVSSHKPSSAFIGASWAALLLGIAAFMAGLWNASMQLNPESVTSHQIILDSPLKSTT